MTDKLLIGVLGATGRTGIPFVTQALGRDHQVRALARSQEKAVTVLPDGAEVVVGDATDPGALRRLVEGVEVVVDVSGAVKGGPTDYRTASTRPLVAVLAGRSGVRLVHLTGAGVRHPDDRPGTADKVVRGIMRMVAGPMLTDSTAAAAMVADADVPTLVVRGPRLTDKPVLGTYTIAEAVGAESGIQVARADLATAILDLLEREEWPTGWPVISA